MSVLSQRRRAALPVAVLATTLTTALVTSLMGAAPAAAQTAPAPAERAAAWLAGSLSPAGTVIATFEGQSSTDYGRTLDTAIALLATGTQPGALGRALGAVEQPDAVASYTRGAPFDVPSEGQTTPRVDAPAYVGGTAKLAFTVELAGGDATRVGGVDLLAQLATLVDAEGRYRDRSNFGDFANLFGHSFALLAQDAAGRTVPANQIARLTAAQCPDGGFPLQYQPAAGQPCRSSVDATGLVLQALGALDLGATPSAQSAATWLRSQQQADGSFPGEVPVNSTGYAASGLRAVDAGSPAAARAAARLAQLQLANGALPGTPGGAADQFATAQALPALADVTFLDGARTVVRRPALGSTAPLCTGVPAGRAFTDLGTSVHAGAVSCLSAYDVVRGFEGGRYGPQLTISRAQAASLLARTLQTAGVTLPAPSTRRFTDVVAGDVHAPSIEALAALGVVRGTTSTTFSPAAPVRRDQMAALLARAYDAAADAPLPAAAPRFTDVAGTHAADIARLSDVGVTVGTTPTTFAPTQPVARDAMASFVARTLNLLLVAGEPVRRPVGSTGS